MKKALLLMVLITFVVAGCATSSRVKRREAVENLQTEVKRLKQITKDVLDLKQTRGATDVKFGELKDEFALLNGRIEEFQHFSKKNDEGLEKINKRLDKIMEDYDKRIRNMEESVEKKNKDLVETVEKLQKKIKEELEEALEKFERVSSRKKSQRKAEEKKADVRYDFINGMKKFKAGEYSRAITYFARYSKNFPAGRSIQNARFFLGQAFYKKGDFQNAILKFEEYKEKFPRGKRVPEALFSQGMSFVKLGKKTDAKLFFTEIVTGHASSSFAREAKRELDRL